MNVGTKSLLFGVHQVFWHPICVARAFRFVYGRWPSTPEWICIAVHDTGYWGKPNMDGPEGQLHPEFGAKLAGKLIYAYARLWRGFDESNSRFFQKLFYDFTLYHSRFYAAKHGASVSGLFLPDKLAVLFEPKWFYILRASFSGEIHEYMANAGDRIPEPKTKWTWLNWYQRKVFNMLSVSGNPWPINKQI